MSSTEPASDGAGNDLWRALASPWRRRLLDLLRDRPRTTGELAEAITELSRFAVMQHLEVLTAAGVVLVERRGRQRFNHLNPVPLRDWYERWVPPVADQAAARLLVLRRLVEDGPSTMGETHMTTTPVDTDIEQIRTVRIACELRFRCTADRLHDTITQNSLSYFPYTYGEDKVKRIVFEPRVGGAHYEDWGDGRGHLYGHVTSYDPPWQWSTRGRLRQGVILDTAYEITQEGPEAVLRMTKTAVGPMTAEEAAGVHFHGDIRNFAEALRAVVEVG